MIIIIMESILTYNFIFVMLETTWEREHMQCLVLNDSCSLDMLFRKRWLISITVGGVRRGCAMNFFVTGYLSNIVMKGAEPLGRRGHSEVSFHVLLSNFGDRES